MNILVCIKQVPNTEEEKLSLEAGRNTMVRSGLSSAMNDFDCYALESAARIKDALSETRIIVLTLGPAQARSVLKDGLAIAADSAYHVCDDAFAGSDAAATSLILAEAIKRIGELEGGVDAVFCGKQTIDGETAIVGAGIAERLCLPQVTCCVEARADGDCLVVEKQVKGGAERIRVALPCLLTFAKPAWNVRYSNIKRKLAANRAVIPVIGLSELSGLDVSRIGLAGSRMKITSTRTPGKKTGGLIISEETPEDSAAKLCRLLDSAGII